MPFILMIGLPSSGKSTRVKQLVDYLCKKGKTTEIIEDSIYFKDKNVTYSGKLVKTILLQRQFI